VSETGTNPVCPACGASGAFPVVEIPSVPVFCNVLCETRERALGVPRGRIDLRCCPSCAMFFNGAFDESRLEYTGRYENALHFSPLFRDYAEALARDLAERHEVAGGNIVEIGCGDGSFLRRVCELAGARGLGIDPAYAAERHDGADDRVRIVAEHYDERLAAEFPADLVLSRHVLEHIADPRPFLGSVRRTLRPGAGVYVEVPDGLWTIERLGIWDLIYEHCSYYTAPSLESLFSSCGFEVASVESSYGGQFLGVHARATEPSDRALPSGEIARIASLARDFTARYDRKLAEWRGLLAEMEREGRSAALWGAGSKGVTFLNIVCARDGSTPVVSAVVDRNPRKQGMHVAGVGVGIVAPESLRERTPDTVIVMNPLYRDEIAAELKQLGVSAQLLTV